jgi:hypothetical protein
MAADGRSSISASLLFHARGVRGYDHIRAEYLGGQVNFTNRGHGSLIAWTCGGGFPSSRQRLRGWQSPIGRGQSAEERDPRR